MDRRRELCGVWSIHAVQLTHIYKALHFLTGNTPITTSLTYALNPVRLRAKLDLRTLSEIMGSQELKGKLELQRLKKAFAYVFVGNLHEKLKGVLNTVDNIFTITQGGISRADELAAWHKAATAADGVSRPSEAVARKLEWRT